MDNRPAWDDYFLNIAEAIAARSDCRRAQIGAVLVDSEHRIYSTGYPGAGAGMPGCLDGHCPRGKMTPEECPPGTDYSNCISIHAEINALMRADFSRNPGSTLYITRAPCNWCSKVIDASGIARAIWPGGERRYQDWTHRTLEAGTGITARSRTVHMTGVQVGDHSQQTNTYRTDV